MKIKSKFIRIALLQTNVAQSALHKKKQSNLKSQKQDEGPKHKKKEKNILKKDCITKWMKIVISEGIDLSVVVFMFVIKRK